MQSFIKIENLLILLTWLLFMVNTCIVEIVAANGTPLNPQEQQQQQKLQETLYAQQQKQQADWYNQKSQPQQYKQQLQQPQQQYQQQYNPSFATGPLSAPTTGTTQQFLGASQATGQEFTTPTPSNNGVGYTNETLSPTESTNDEDDDKRPSEIQKAVCTVTAGEVRASAEAVTTKKLKGVCGSAELKLAFSDLEAKLYKELQEIKTLLKYLAQKQGINVPLSFTTANAPLQQNPMSPVSSNSVAPSVTASASTHQHSAPLSQQRQALPTTKTTTATRPLFQPIAEPKLNTVDTSAEVSYEYEETGMTSAEDEDALPKKVPQFKSLKSVRTKSQVHPPSSDLQQEIKKFNNTLLSDSELKVFTYYWKLENFTARIESGSSTMVESPTFLIKGKPLHLRVYFQHLNRDFLYLQLSHASIKSSNRHNVIIDMGGLFKEIANDKISFKHKITVLNQLQNMNNFHVQIDGPEQLYLNSMASVHNVSTQYHNHRSKDLVSQEFNNLETGFIIPNSALLKSPYIKNDSLLIQIFLYL